MIVVSVLERSLAALRAQALAQVPHADKIELRLDHVGNPGVDELTELITAITKPVIVAVNGPDAHGFFRGERDERFATLAAAARAGAAFIDVDWKDARLQGPLPSTCRRIVSRHEMDALPPLESAWAELEANARPTDVLKLVAHARSGEDGVRMLESVATRARDVVGFASGEAGSFTRVLAPIFGSMWTYAAPARIEGVAVSAPSAPGQLRADELRSMWPARAPSRETRVFAVVGNPVGHSLSPRVHTAALRALDFDGVYVAIAPQDFGDFLVECRSPNWGGLSVTAPFKTDAFAAAAESNPDSKATRASNTLVRRSDGTWSAYNTDVPAITASIEGALASRARIRLADARIVVIGTGGAARAAAFALRGARSVTIAGRNALAREEISRDLGCAACAPEALPQVEWDVLVNCTPLGSGAHPAAMPVDARILGAGKVVMDAVYRPANTPLIEAARQAGALAVPGANWFVRQAALQFALFTHLDVDEQILRAEFDRALAERPAVTRTIALVGLRASGKSSVGRALAELLHFPFVDLDERMARTSNSASVGELFVALGEPAFRELEARVLEEALAQDEPMVIATGGGVIERERNRRLLAEHAFVIWLDVPVPELQRRLRADPNGRPALTGSDAITEVTEISRRRGPLYAEIARLRIEASEGAPGAIAQGISLRLSGPGRVPGDTSNQLPS